MAVKAFSDEWAAQFKDEVNKSSAYKAAGKGWKWTVGLVVEAEPDKHFPESRGLVMDLFDGDARDIRVGSAGDAQKCDFVITAPYTRSKQVALQLEVPLAHAFRRVELLGRDLLPARVRSGDHEVAFLRVTRGPDPDVPSVTVEQVHHQPARLRDMLVRLGLDDQPDGPLPALPGRFVSARLVDLVLELRRPFI